MDNRAQLLKVLATMPEEAFGWFVVWALGSGGPFPKHLGGFRPDSRSSVAALRLEAQRYFDHFNVTDASHPVDQEPQR